MTQNTNPIATAADYADALLIARRAKGWLVFLLLAILLIQLAVFFVMAYGAAEISGKASAAAPEAAPTTQAVVDAETPAEAATQAAAPAIAAEAKTANIPAASAITPAPRTRISYLFEYVITGTTFIGLGASIVLAIVLLLMVLIMQIGRLIGVSRLTSAFVWSIVLIVLLLPWQTLLTFEGVKPERDFRIPGVLMTWPELATHGRDVTTASINLPTKILRWSRFAAFPIVTLLVLVTVNTKSSRGLKLALGESEPSEPENG
ncbi:MAG: hypothetical protein IT448_02170 [Phycisphaerales bacterium]|nr:hypothetical protein [Phycisphaerales bacterium]